MSALETIRRVLRPLGATSIGLTLIALFTVYAALGTLPLFPAPDGVPGSGGPVPIRVLDWIDKSEGEYFAWWPGVALLVGIVVNMSASMLTRVAWRWGKAPVLLTHAGVGMLAMGSALYASQKIEGQVVLLAPEAGEESGPAVSEMTDGTGANPVHIPGVALAFRDLRIEMVPGTDVPRQVTLDVRAVAGGAESERVVTLNQPLVLEGLTPPTCDCFIRGPLERLWHGWINPVRWKFSLAGWDQEGWVLSREGAIAGLTDRPRARFALLGVGNTPGVRVIGAGAVMMLLGMVGGLWKGQSTEHKAQSTYGEAEKRKAKSEKRKEEEGIQVESVARAGVGSRRLALLFAYFPALVMSASTPPSRAAEIDPVASLRTLPVQWNGRVAALDTAARDIVRAASGRERVPGKDRRATREDPLATLLDLALRPEDNLDRPLISSSGVRGSAWAGDAPADASGLLTIREAEAVLARMMQAPDARALPVATRLAERVAVAKLGIRALPLAAPDASAPALTAADWLDARSDHTPPPVRAALDGLADVWRAGDTGAAVLAANHLSSVLRAHNLGRYNAGRVWFEVLASRLAPLEKAGWLSGAAAVLLLVALLGRWGGIAFAGGVLMALGWMLHAAGFAARWFVAGRLPVQNQYESMIAVALAVTTAVGGLWLIGSLVARRESDDSAEARRAVSMRVLGFAAALVSFVVLSASHALPIPGRIIEVEAAILGTAVLLKYHVMTVLTAYALIALAGVSAALWLLAGLAPRRCGSARAALGPPLRPLSYAGFLVLTVGILLGALWADRAWGRWWAFDPKETWALITWLVLLSALHVRRESHRARAWLLVLGTLVMTWSWFGVNLLLPGLHAYAGN